MKAKGVRYLLVLGLVLAGMIGGVAAAAVGSSGIIAKVTQQPVKEVWLSWNKENGIVTVATSGGEIIGTVKVNKMNTESPVRTLEIGKIVESAREIILYVNKTPVGRIKNIGAAPHLTEEQKKKAIDIASKDPRVNVQASTILSIGPNVAVDENGQVKITGATIWAMSGDKCYSIVVSFGSNNVTNIYPVSCPSSVSKGMQPST